MQTPTLMEQYVATVNRSIENNRDRFPYKQLIEASRPMTEGLQMQVAVYKDEPSQPHDFFTLAWTGNELDMVGHGKDNGADVSWKVPVAHLEEVVTEPERFVREPAKLDLDWLGRRIGIA